MVKKSKKQMEEAPNPLEFIAQVRDVDSEEIYWYPGDSVEKVLRGISLDIRRGECWCIVGEEAFEIDLLLEIIGSVRPYYRGRIVLGERGMMRKKRRVLPHVFFIADGNAIFPNMNVLEYLMFATAHMPGDAAGRQANILKRLLDTGLYYMTLTPIKYLSRAQKAVVSLLAASFTWSLLIIFSVTQLSFDKRLSRGIRAITDIITKGGGGILIGTTDLQMAQAVGTHAAFLLDGTISHSGSVEDMMAGLDKRVYVIKSQSAEELAEKLRDIAPYLTLSVHEEEVHVFDYRPEQIRQSNFLELIDSAGIGFDSLTTSRKTLENAYREVISGYDL